MDDPLFDPWGTDSDESRVDGSAGTLPSRWRSRDGGTPRVPTSGKSLSPRSTTDGPSTLHARPPTPRWRLSGKAGFLRSMAVPRLSSIALKLEMARHEAQIDDLLDDPTPVLRLRFRPWRGPWTAELSPPGGALELCLEGGADDELLVRQWLDVDSPEPSEESRVAVSRVSGAWLESLALQFVEGVLSRA